jgi:hypothetical protein
LRLADAGPGDYKVKGSPGLYLRKGDNGSGSWRFRFRFGSKRPQMGLGALAAMTLAQARAKADELRPQVRNGVNPILARRAAKIAVAEKARADAIAADRWTFARTTDEYLRAHARSWKHRDAVRTWRNPIVKYAYPIIGGLRLDDIQVEHIDAVMSAAVKGGAPKVAARIRNRIEQIINLGHRPRPSERRSRESGEREAGQRGSSEGGQRRARALSSPRARRRSKRIPSPHGGRSGLIGVCGLGVYGRRRGAPQRGSKRQMERDR